MEVAKNREFKGSSQSDTTETHSSGTLSELLGSYLVHF